MTIKIIFLDIDGVLVTRRLGVFEEPLLQNLKRVVDETGATIVLSSDWRRHPQARLEAKRVLATVGLSFIACTPCLSAYIAQRPTEIMQWKKGYTKHGDSERITHWVAIDDRPLLEERHGSYLRGHFVQTQPIRGLSPENCDECIAILNQELPDQQRPSQTGTGLACAEAAAATMPLPEKDKGLTALLETRGAAIRYGNSTGSGSGARGSSTGAAGGLGSSPGSKRLGPSSQALAALGPSVYNLGDGKSSPGSPGDNDGRRPVPAGLPSQARQRGRSTGAPPMVGLSRR